MKKNFFTLIITLFAGLSVSAQARLDSLLPVRGFCIAAPAKEHVDEFVKFINEKGQYAGIESRLQLCV